MTHSTAQIILRRMLGLSASNEMERMWKEAVTDLTCDTIPAFLLLGPEHMLQMHRSHVGLLCYPRFIQVF